MWDPHGWFNPGNGYVRMAPDPVPTENHGGIRVCQDKLIGLIYDSTLNGRAVK